MARSIPKAVEALQATMRTQIFNFRGKIVKYNEILSNSSEQFKKVIEEMDSQRKGVELFRSRVKKFC